MQFNISQICSYWLSIYKNQFNIVKEEYKRGYKRGGHLSEGGDSKFWALGGGFVLSLLHGKPRFIVIMYKLHMQYINDIHRFDNFTI